jgi:hypothetical protein
MLSDEPSLINGNGARFWLKDGYLHRDNNKPALIYPSGIESYYVNNRAHRDDGGPALVGLSNEELWYIHGERLSEKQILFLKKILTEDVKFLPWLFGEEPIMDYIIERRLNE